MTNGKSKTENERLCTCVWRPKVDIHFGDLLYRCKCGGVFPDLTPEEQDRRVRIVKERLKGHTH